MSTPRGRTRYIHRHNTETGVPAGIHPNAQNPDNKDPQTTIDPDITTARLDCGKCEVDAPQAALRDGTFDSTCSTPHRRTRQ